MGCTSSGRKYGTEVLSEDNNKRCITIVLHVNSNESKNNNTSNSDDDKRTPTFTYSTVQNGSPSNKLIDLPEINDTESSVFINDVSHAGT